MKFIGKKILIVEDDEINILLLEILFEENKVNTVFCKDSYEFFEKYTGNEDIIILDIRIPGEKDGKDLLKYIKESNPEKIVIMQTAYPDERAECLKLGANDFIQKPFAMPTLLNSIEKILKIIEE